MAEIVGAILLFAVIITIFTSFMVWYIPAQTANNESHYELQTKSSLGTLVSDLHNGILSSGTTISESIPLGISGVAIFSSAQDTEFSILPAYSSFNASLTFNVTIVAANNTGTQSTHYLNESYAASGIMASNGNTQYVTAINYIVEDGALFQNYGNNQPPNSLGPMPLGIANNSGAYSLNMEIFSISGFSETYSSSQSQVINLQINSSKTDSLVNGTLAAISGSEYTIQSMKLNSMNYTIRGSLVDAWDFGFFNQFNATQPGYPAVIGLHSWHFSASPLYATLSGNGMSISTSSPLTLSTFTTEAVIVNGN